MKSIFRIFQIASLAGILAFLSGCASPTNPAAMSVIEPLGIKAKHPESVSIRVTGGRETSKGGTSQISDADFTLAIEKSIRDSELFASVVGGDGTVYRIDVMIISISQPLMGFDMTVSMEATWKLIRVNDKRVVWQKGISSKATAKVSDAFAGVTRLRMATEMAGRENITLALREIGQLDL